MTDNDEAMWKQRFLMLMLIRFTALAMVLAGIAFAGSDLVQPGGNKIVGGLLIAAGIFAMFFLPRIMRREWEKK